MRNEAGLDMDTMFDENFDYVWHNLRRLGVHYADLEDVTQEVFLKFFKRIADYDAKRPVRHWLFGFAYRIAADYRRRLRFRAETLVGSCDGLLDESTAEEPKEEYEHQQMLLKQALQYLNEGRRAILVLHDLDEVPVPEIAKRLGISVNTAYSRLRLARAALVQATKRMQRTQDAP